MTFVARFFDDESEWRRWRKAGVGASDVAAIGGLPGAYGSRYSLWVDKLDLVPDDRSTNEQQFGRDAEAMIATVCPRETGLYPFAAQLVCESVDRPWMRATLDALLGESPSLVPTLITTVNGVSSISSAAVAVLELKTTGPQKDFDEIPDIWRAQGQWQLAVTGLAAVVFLVLHGRRWAVYHLERDDDDIDWLTETVERFWFDHVVTGDAPDVDAHDATTYALNHRWQASDDTVDLGPEAVKIIEDLKHAKREQKWWVGRRTLLENTLKAELGEATAGLVAGNVAVTWRPVTSERIDSKALRAAEPDVAKRFTNISESRTLLLKGDK